MQPFPDASGYDEYMDTDSYIETQTKILESETLALATIKSLDLARYPEYGGNSDAAYGSANRADRAATCNPWSVSRQPHGETRAEQPVDRGAI